MKRVRTVSPKPAKTRHRNTSKPKRSTVSTAARGASSSVAELQNQIERQARELDEAREQQAATSEVLRVISSSPGELEPVFQAMLENATRICGAKFGALSLREGDAFRGVAMHGVSPALAELRQREPLIRPTPGHNLERLMRTKDVIHVPDLSADMCAAPVPYELEGARALLNVPLLKENELIGSILIYRQEAGPFGDRQIELVKNFAAQAVIAMDNARLLSELRQRTADLSESLEQQTATSEVLHIISRSPGELEPAFQTMLENATRICDAKFGSLTLRDGDGFRIGALHNAPPAFADYVRHGLMHPGPNMPIARMARTKQVVHVTDITMEQAYIERDPLAVAGADLGGYRTILLVPMLKESELIGAIIIFRQQVRPFTDKQIDLVTNFADQAVIAIENVRLLNELRESLQQQTATADVLKVISRSTFDLRAVLDTLVESAARLCEADMAAIRMPKDTGYQHVASYGIPPDYIEAMRAAPLKSGRSSVIGRVLLGRQTVHIHDVLADPEFVLLDIQRAQGLRTALGVPLMREGAPIGVLFLSRKQVRPFTDKQIELVSTFADQAVIAVENTRLLNELRSRTDELGRSVGELRALGEVSQAVNSTLDLETVLSTIVAKAVPLSGTEAGAIYVYDEEAREFRPRATYGMDAPLIDALSHRHIGIDEANLATAFTQREPIQIADLREEPSSELNDIIVHAGFRARLLAPLIRGEEIVGMLVVRRRTPGVFPQSTVDLIKTFAAQSVLTIQNARLFHEIADKSRQVEEASKHKSQFLANMSHELRTPLNAILGYTELILDSIYGEAPAKMRSVLERVQTNGKHLLGLINDVLDLSKIEAGQLMLSLDDYSIADLVQGVHSAVEPLASSKKLAFKIEVPTGLPPARGDDRRLAQVLLNLVGNAIKFTDAGEVAVKAAAENGAYTISVRDTGPGIAVADQTKIFEEFQQADSSQTKTKGGTGLGLSIARRIVEMHGGRLWVESSPGQGSTFSFTVPVRVQEQAKRS